MKVIYILLLVCIGGSTLWAQEKVPVKKEATQRTVTNIVNDTISIDYNDRIRYVAPFWSNFYLKADFSGRMFCGEEDTRLKFGDRIKPGYLITLGKAFHPDYAIQISFGGHRLDGWTDTQAPGVFKQHSNWLENEDPMRAYYDSKGVNTEKGYIHQIKYWELNADILFDLYNIFTKNNESNSRWDVDFYTGMGLLYMKRWHGSSRNAKAAFRLGLVGSWNFSERFGLNLTLGAAITDATFDGIIGKGSKADAIITGSLGLTWRFGRQGFKVVRMVPTEQLEALTNVITGVKHREVIEPAVPAAVMATSTAGLLVPSIVFNRNEVVYNEELQQVNVFRVARFMEEYPETKITIVGNVKGTNDSLAKNRAKHVRDILINQYGVDKKRLKIDTFDVNAKYGLRGYDNSVNFTFTK